MLRSVWLKANQVKHRSLDLEQRLCPHGTYLYDAVFRSSSFQKGFLKTILEESLTLSEGQVGGFIDRYGRHLLVIRTCVDNVVFLERGGPYPVSDNPSCETRVYCYRSNGLLEGVVREGEVDQATLFHYLNPFNGRNIGHTLKGIREGLIAGSREGAIT